MVDREAVRVVKFVKGVTCEDLARRAGVHRITAHRWENNDPRVSSETADKLLHALMETTRTPAAPAE